MARYEFSAVAGTVLEGFDPLVDALGFVPDMAAAKVRLLGSDAGTLVSHGTGSVLLAGVQPWSLGQLQLLFDDGSQFVRGGADDDVLSTGLLDDQLDGGTGADTMSGGDGGDTYQVDNLGDFISEAADAAGVDHVISTVSHALGSGVENLTLVGTRGRTGSGNELDNRIRGGDGNDTLRGGDGLDTLAGGAGNDLYELDAQDLVSEASGGGTDTVLLQRTRYVLPTHVENVKFQTGEAVYATGNASANVMTGGTGANKLVGGAGADTLKGGSAADVLDGGSGADSMAGGDGSDRYYVDSQSDIVTESRSAQGGIDTVVASVSRVLGSYQENLILTGTARLAGTGNSLANSIRGNDGANLLDGAAGRDTLIGGLGNDDYRVDASDVVVERAGGGTDRIHASVSYTLGGYVEDLTLLGTRHLAGTGHAGANRIDGNSGNNVLAGGGGNDTLSGAGGNDRLLGGAGDDSLRGGEGADTLAGGAGRNTMVGGAGADTYVVDSASDRIIEESSYQIEVDTVISSVDRTLGANQDNLVLVGKARKGVGSGDDNWIKGNDLNNVLDGRGGYDTLVGGKGNDTYHVDRADDSVIESWNGGVDHVIASSDWTLGMYQEHLTLTGEAWTIGEGNELANRITGSRAMNSISGMDGNDTIAGGDGNDRLWGGAGNDHLDGGAGNDTIVSGQGSDFIRGGAGSDAFRYESEQDSNPRQFDTILDFERGKDVIDLSALYFGANSAFKPFIGKAAFDTEDATGQVRYTYDAASRSVMVYVSADATGDAEGALRIMGISSLSASDFNFFDWW